VRRYLLSYLAAYVASLAAFGGMLLIGIANWLFTDSPLWFDVLCVVVVCLPMLALGEVLGRRPKAKLVQKPIRGLLILLAVMAAMGIASALVESLQIFSWPGLLLGNAIQTLLRRGNYWDGAFILLGNLLLPALFHLGWYWGTTAAQ